MNVDPKKVTRLNELLDLGEKVLKTKFSSQLGDFGSYHQVDDSKSYEWAMKCLSTLEELFGKRSLHYGEFKNLFEGFTSIEGYDCTKRAFAVLKVAKEDYENGHINKQTPEANIQIIESPNITKDLINMCELEAKRNTRIYLTIIFVFLGCLVSVSFYYLGIKFASILTLGILVISYLLSALFLKEWTPTKLHERLLEIERSRMYKRFNVNTN